MKNAAAKVLTAIGLTLLSIQAKADLFCQGYDTSGRPVPIKMTVSFASPHDTTTVGDTILLINDKTRRLRALYRFGTARTRCEAGLTVQANESGFQFQVYAWNSCDAASRTGGIKGELKGTLNWADASGHSRTLFVGCDQGRSTN